MPEIENAESIRTKFGGFGLPLLRGGDIGVADYAITPKNRANYAITPKNRPDYAITPKK